MLLISFSSVKMGMADAIVDLVSSGTTLRENNLKEIEGGVVLESQVSLISLTHARPHTQAHVHTLKQAIFPTSNCSYLCHINVLFVL